MARTAFQVDRDGFPFVNSWKMKPDERVQLKQTLAAGSSEAVETAGFDPFGMVRSMVMPQLNSWIDGALPDYYGLCGGMAFAAADHFRAGKPIPYGLDPAITPNSDDPQDKAIRDYLWQRQLESLKPNASVLLSWMMMLHLPIPGAGPIWLRDRTREQFTNLKAFLQHGPWPLCLIGSSVSPFNNHQVLAVGLDDNGDGTGVVYLYDSNCPGREQTLKLDMRGDALQAAESCPVPERGALRGFFCEHYAPATPPDLPRGSKPKPAPAPRPAAEAAPPTKPAPAPKPARTAPAAKPRTPSKPGSAKLAAEKPAAAAKPRAPKRAPGQLGPGVTKIEPRPTPDEPGDKGGEQ